MANGTEATPSVLELAESALAQTKGIVKYLQSSGVALPTFSPTCEALPVAADFQELQNNLRMTLEDLQLMMDGPSHFYRHFLMRGYEIAAFQVALEFDFFTLVPSEGEISLAELAKKVGLDEDRTGRIIRLLITHRFFQERRPGFFSHNSFSIALQQDDETRSLVHYSYDEMLKAAANTSNALQAHPYETDSVHCAFFSRFGIPIFEYYKEVPQHSARFAKAMAGWRKMANNVTELRDLFPWQETHGTVVDIGGGSGHVSIVLAKEFPHLRFIVQDGGDDMLAQGQRLLSDDVRGRISFERQDFFQPQPRQGAAVYLMRQCTHNWADHDVVRMFTAVVPALEASAPGTPLLINDMILPEPGSDTVSRARERELRQADMIMLVCYGAKQRTTQEFEKLLKAADARYEIRKVTEKGALGLIEAVLVQ